MKKLTMLLIASLCVLFSFAQDNMVKHNGEKLAVKVVKVGETTIIYKYPNEDAEQTIGKYAVASITYASGRKEVISEKIMVDGKGDWEKVVVLTDKSQVLGLKEGEEVRGKTAGMISYRSAASSDKKASERIKKDAAEQGCPFVLMTSDKSDGYGVKQSIKNGMAYKY